MLVTYLKLRLLHGNGAVQTLSADLNSSPPPNYLYSHNGFYLLILLDSTNQVNFAGFQPLIRIAGEFATFPNVEQLRLIATLITSS